MLIVESRWWVYSSSLYYSLNFFVFQIFHNKMLRKKCEETSTLGCVFVLCVLSRSVMSDSSQACGPYPPGSSVHGILQARFLEWVAISFSRGSSQPRIECMSLTSPALQADSLPTVGEEKSFPSTLLGSWLRSL